MATLNLPPRTITFEPLVNIWEGSSEVACRFLPLLVQCCPDQPNVLIKLSLRVGYNVGG